jgi:hypothetical protein
MENGVCIIRILMLVSCGIFIVVACEKEERGGNGMRKFFRWLTKYHKSKNISNLLSIIIFMIVFFTYEILTPHMSFYFALTLVAILMFVHRLLEELFRRLLGTRNLEIKDRYYIFALILFITVNTFII